MPSCSRWSRRSSTGRKVDDDTLAIEAMRGGRARAATSSAPPHTQSRFRTAFHKPMLSDWRNYESWEEAGSPQAAGQGEPDLEGAPRRLQPPPMDPARAEELQAFVDRRKAEGGVPTDY